MASGFRCKWAGVVPGFVVRLGDGADSFGAAGDGAGGDGAWLQLGGWFQERAAQGAARGQRPPDGHRESSESWADLLRNAARRGMRPSVLAAGDGALGSWKALREVFPET